MKKLFISLFLSLIGFTSFGFCAILDKDLAIQFEDSGVCSFSSRTSITDFDFAGKCYSFSPDIMTYLNSYTIDFYNFENQFIDTKTFDSNTFCVVDNSYQISFYNPSCKSNSDFVWQYYDFNFVESSDIPSDNPGTDTGTISGMEILLTAFTYIFYVVFALSIIAILFRVIFTFFK